MSASFEQLLEHSIAAACIVQDGRLTYANPRFSAIFGYEREELTRRCSLQDLLHPDDLPRLWTLVREALRGGESQEAVRLRGVRSDGEIVCLEGTAAVVEVGGRRAVVGTLMDVTELARVQQLYRESEERFGLVTRATNNVILDWDLASNEIRWNEMIHEAFLYSADEVGGTYEWWSDRIHPDDQRQVLTSIESALRQEGQLWTSEYRFRRGDGSYATVLGRAYIVRGEGQRPVRVMGAMVDVTEHRQLEERFYLSQRMEAVGRLAGGVAHDFNNVLMVIQGTTDLLLTQQGLGDTVRADVREIKKAAERATALTRQLLAFGRRQVLRPEVVNLNTTILDMEGMFRRILGEDIQLVSQLDRALGCVRVDPRQFEQVLLNLAANARDAMPHGGRLTIHTMDVHLTEEDTAKFTYPVLPGKYVRVSVQDTGIGMDTATLTQMFEPFFTTKGSGKGTGLGLSTVYGIIKQSGGYIWVTSEVSHGARFDLYLPRTDARSPVSEPQPGPVAVHPRSETILLVEDEDAVRSIARRILESGGYHVLEARSGPDALQVCEVHGAELDALITDVVMPDMSGRELAARITADYPHVRVLYMSGHTDDRILQHGLGRKRVNLIQKPFGPNALLERVRALIEPGD